MDINNPMSNPARMDKAIQFILLAVLHLEGIKRNLRASNSPLTSRTGKVLDQLNAVDLAMCDLRKALVYEALEDAESAL
jgi:hypothetical protein